MSSYPYLTCYKPIKKFLDNMYNNGYPQPSPAVPAAAAYGNYGAYSANPVSYPQQATNSASQYRFVYKKSNNNLTYSTAQQYGYPTAAAAYAQYGQSAAQQQSTPTNQSAAATAAAGFGPQMDYSANNYSDTYGYSNGNFYLYLKITIYFSNF